MSSVLGHLIRKVVFDSMTGESSTCDVVLRFVQLVPGIIHQQVVEVFPWSWTKRNYQLQNSGLSCKYSAQSDAKRNHGKFRNIFKTNPDFHKIFESRRHMTLQYYVGKYDWAQATIAALFSVVHSYNKWPILQPWWISDFRIISRIWVFGTNVLWIHGFAESIVNRFLLLTGQVI